VIGKERGGMKKWVAGIGGDWMGHPTFANRSPLLVFLVIIGINVKQNFSV